MVRIIIGMVSYTNIKKSFPPILNIINFIWNSKMIINKQNGFMELLVNQNNIFILQL